MTTISTSRDYSTTHMQLSLPIHDQAQRYTLMPLRHHQCPVRTVSPHTRVLCTVSDRDQCTTARLEQVREAQRQSRVMQRRIEITKTDQGQHTGGYLSGHAAGRCVVFFFFKQKTAYEITR